MAEKDDTRTAAPPDCCARSVRCSRYTSAMHRYELVVEDVASLSIRTVESEQSWTVGDRLLTGSDSLLIDEVTTPDEFGIARVVCKRIADFGAVTPLTPRGSG